MAAAAAVKQALLPANLVGSRDPHAYRSHFTPHRPQGILYRLCFIVGHVYRGYLSLARWRQSGL